MDIDDGPQKQDGPLALLIREDLASLSIDELQGRIETLEREVIRVKALIESKDQSRATAEAFFKQSG